MLIAVYHPYFGSTKALRSANTVLEQGQDFLISLRPRCVDNLNIVIPTAAQAAPFYPLASMSGLVRPQFSVVVSIHTPVRGIPWTLDSIGFLRRRVVDAG